MQEPTPLSEITTYDMPRWVVIGGRMVDVNMIRRIRREGQRIDVIVGDGYGLHVASEVLDTDALTEEAALEQAIEHHRPIAGYARIWPDLSWWHVLGAGQYDPPNAPA